MSRVRAVFVRELRSLFQSPVAYVSAAMFLLINGFIFVLQVRDYVARSQMMQQPQMFMAQQGPLNVTENIIEPMFFTMAFITLFLLPMVTMRVYAEEKRQGTIELLMSYPVRDWEVLLGKFFACTGVYVFMVLPTIVYVLLVRGLATPETGSIITGYLGMLLTGMAFIATGIFVSTLTANQIIAAVVSYSVLLIFWVLGVVESYVPTAIGAVLNQLSLFTHIEKFAQGVIESHDVIFYVLWIGVFLFLASLSLETQRWRGKTA